MGARGPQGKKPEPGNLQKLPSAPKRLGEVGKKKWREFGNEMIAMRMIDAIDLHSLERLCVAYDRLEDAQHELSKGGMTLISEKGGCYTNPAFNVVCNAEKQIEQYIKMLGLTRRMRVDMISKPEQKTQTVAARKRK